MDEILLKSALSDAIHGKHSSMNSSDVVIEKTNLEKPNKIIIF
jgi:hypothetical protein